MLTIKRIMCNMLQENCYVVSDETKECVIIDCGAQYPEERSAIIHYIKDEGLHPVHLLATHGHLDHNWGTSPSIRSSDSRSRHGLRTISDCPLRETSSRPVRF